LRDLTEAKSAYDDALLHKSYEKLSYYVVTLEHALPIVWTVGFTPEIDFHGNRLQSLDNVEMFVDHLTCSVLMTATGSAIVFAWLAEKNGASTALINSLDRIKTHQLSSAIVRLIFEHGENVFFSPSWWNDLDDRTKTTIARHANSTTDKSDHCLMLDGSLQVLWSIVDRKKVVR